MTMNMCINISPKYTRCVNYNSIDRPLFMSEILNWDDVIHCLSFPADIFSNRQY